ncbi:hypothetical protein VBP92_27125 [Klebsiella variicola]|uniref:hypothetical protein n=1 Tax=Klebsiella variicola TaxID=244366 RepID=UPI002B1FCDEF|nr:hypothetical protein [Klebsiella variicola]MEA5495556.1 hypothetical protein [Klebsiella variicola]
MSNPISVEPVTKKAKEDVEVIELRSYESKLGSAEFDIDKERFVLARGILLCLFTLTIIVIFIRVEPNNIKDDNVKEVFNTVFQSIVPIASLIIGYYFGSKGKE